MKNERGISRALKCSNHTTYLSIGGMLIRPPLPFVLLLLVQSVVIVRAYQPPPGLSHHSTPKPPHQHPPRSPQYEASRNNRRDLISTATTTLAGCSSLLFLGSSRPFPAHATDAREAIFKVSPRSPGMALLIHCTPLFSLASGK